MCKSPRTIGRSDPHNQHHKSNTTRSIQNVLQDMNVSQSGTEESHIELSISFSTEKNLDVESSTTPLLPERNFSENCSLKSPPPLNINLSSTTESAPLTPKPKTDLKTDRVEPGEGVSSQSDSWKNSQSFRNCNLALHLITVNNVNTINTLASPASPMSISPSEPPQEPEGLSRRDSENCCSRVTGQNWSSLSTDSIDFFSAREKFQGLSQDGQNSVYEELTPCSSSSRSNSPCLEKPSGTAATEVKTRILSLRIVIHMNEGLKK